MNNSIYRISLDLHNINSQTSLSVKKVDKYRSLHITLTENGKPYKIAEGCFAFFNAKKPDGNSIHNVCQIDGNKIVYDLTTQTTAAVGTVECEITLYDSDPRLDTEDKKANKITSPNFAMVVEDTVYNGEEILSSPEADALKEVIAQSEIIKKEVEETADKVSTQADNIIKHNSEDNTLAHPNIMREVEIAKSIARGKANSLVFSTENDLLNWVDGAFVREDGKTIQDLAIGDNLYVVEINKPDYWWDGTAIQPLETEKPDLSVFVERTELEQQIGQTVIRTMSREDYDTAYLAGTLDAGVIYFVYEE